MSTVTDHRALVWLYSFKDPEGMVARWLEKLGQFDFEIKHKAGRSIPHADCLSRVLPEEEDPITVYVAALTENTTMEEHPANPWMLIQNTDRNSMQMKQHEDNNIKKVLKWIEEKQRPDRKNMNGASKELWNFWVDFKNLRLIQGLLFRTKKLEDGDRWVHQLIVAENQISNILPLLHESPCTGHFGIEKTYQRAQERFFWPGMKRDVNSWVQRCDKCLRRKGTPQKHRHSPKM